jgi:hypothetical protein
MSETVKLTARHVGISTNHAGLKIKATMTLEDIHEALHAFAEVVPVDVWRMWMEEINREG